MATAPALDAYLIDGEWVGAAIPMPLETYMSTMFHPDRDYIDGFAEERPMGEFEHSRVQLALLQIFRNKEEDWKVIVVPECRLQIHPGRFRILDVMVLRADQKVHRYPTTAPLICIEVLSPEDRKSRLRQVLDDYLSMGAENVWAFDPETREAFRYHAHGFTRMEELTVEGTAIRVNAAEVFAILN